MNPHNLVIASTCRFNSSQTKNTQTSLTYILAMQSFFFLAFLASSISATPLYHPSNDTLTNSPLQPRGTCPDLVVKTYIQKGCHGKGNTATDINYNAPIAFQMASYKLSRDLGPDEVMDMFASAGWGPTSSDPIDPAMNGLADQACAQHTWTVTRDKTTKGCHDLTKNMGCMKITI